MSTDNQSGEFTSTPIDPFGYLTGATIPRVIIYAGPKSGSLVPPGAKVECKINDSGKFVIRVGIEDWTEPQNLGSDSRNILVEEFIRVLWAYARVRL
jgi:hypothetical protein